MRIVAQFPWKRWLILVDEDGVFWSIEIDKFDGPTLKRLIDSRLIEKLGEPS